MKINKNLLTLFLFLATLYSSSISAHSHSENLAKKFVSNGGFQVGNGSKLQFQAEKQFNPASILKIPTALLALELLGSEFRFTTRLYLDHENNLYIQGGGDPFLTSETIFTLCQQLKREYPELEKVNSLNLDDSLYALHGKQVSTEHSRNPYDSPNGALAVNFNTVSISVGTDGTVSSGEQQTPTLPMMTYKAKLLKLVPGIHRINIASGEQENESIPLLYAAELFKAQLKASGIEVTGKMCKKSVPPELHRPLFVYKSEKTLQEMLRLLLHYSSNFIANQIFLQLSLQNQENHTIPATWERSQQIAASFFQRKFALSSDDLKMVEGSGLSLKNHMTCKATISLLENFRPWALLLRKQNDNFFKSGTMPKTGIFSYAGYFKREKELIPYVVMLNQQQNTRRQLQKELGIRTP